MEREEKEKVKKREKKLEDEETMQQATWVKYTFPIKHQVSHTCTNYSPPTWHSCNQFSVRHAVLLCLLPVLLCFLSQHKTFTDDMSVAVMF